MGIPDASYVIELLSSLNAEIEGHGLSYLLSSGEFSNDLLVELIRLVTNLSGNQGLLPSRTLLRFKVYYLYMLLGKESDISTAVDILCGEPVPDEDLRSLDKAIVAKLVWNVKGRLRRLPVRDTRFDNLVALLERLGAVVPNDLLRAVHQASIGSDGLLINTKV